MRLAVTMTHGSRPVYSRQSLVAVERALRGAPEVDVGAILLHVEPMNAEVQKVCVSFVGESPRREMHLNPQRHGVNRNTIAAINHGFALSADFVLHVEDDILLAPDALRYFVWAAERYETDMSVATVTGYNREPAMPERDQWHAVRRRCWFHPWAWGTWRDRWWKLIRPAIDPDARLTWDCQVNQAIIKRRMAEVYPVLARANNIGHYSSIHPGAFTPEWYAEHHTLKHWADGVDVLPDEFREVDAPLTTVEWLARCERDLAQAAENERRQQETLRQATCSPVRKPFRI